MAAGVALVPMTYEARRIADLEARLAKAEHDAAFYEGLWRNVCRLSDEKADRIRELTAALSRLGLRLPA